jgi:hypothetical protein
VKTNVITVEKHRAIRETIAVRWSADLPPELAAHEAGHLLGLVDMYYGSGELRGHPVKGQGYGPGGSHGDWTGNIMAGSEGAVEERNIWDPNWGMLGKVDKSGVITTRWEKWAK